MAYSVEGFVADVDRVLKGSGATVEGSWSLGHQLQRLVEEGGDLTQQGAPSSASSGRAGRVLHVDADGRFRLVVAKFPSGEPTPIHSHRHWGLECGVLGRERFTVWARVDDGGEPGRSKLQVLSDHHIERGDLGYWYDAPRNVHRQWAEGSEPSCVMILMGGDGSRDHHFDLAAGTHADV